MKPIFMTKQRNAKIENILSPKINLYMLIEPLQKGVVRVWSAYARPSWSTRINMAHSFIHKIL